MDTKTIVIGVIIGVFIGAAGIYVVDMSRISRLNREVVDLREENEHLNVALDAKQEIIDAQEDLSGLFADLEEEIEAKDLLLQEYEGYKESAGALIANSTALIKVLNELYAYQTYRAEEALTLLHDYLPEYESEIYFAAVYGGLSFEEWWEINSGTTDEWRSLVYG